MEGKGRPTPGSQEEGGSPSRLRRRGQNDITLIMSLVRYFFFPGGSLTRRKRDASDGKFDSGNRILCDMMRYLGDKVANYSTRRRLFSLPLAGSER